MRQDFIQLSTRIEDYAELKNKFHEHENKVTHTGQSERNIAIESKLIIIENKLDKIMNGHYTGK